MNSAKIEDAYATVKSDYQSEHPLKSIQSNENKYIALKNISEAKNRKEEDKPSNSNYSIGDVEKNTLLSYSDHLMLSYFCCCISPRVRKVSKFYNELSEYFTNYLDYANICNNILETEKIKYLLMDPDQIALFSVRKKIQLLEDEEEPSNEISKHFYFIHELHDEIETDKIRKELESKNKDDTINQRLLELTA